MRDDNLAELSPDAEGALYVIGRAGTLRGGTLRTLISVAREALRAGRTSNRLIAVGLTAMACANSSPAGLVALPIFPSGQGQEEGRGVSGAKIGEVTMAFDEAATIDSLWEARQRGDFFPDAWIDRLTIDQAYRIQLGILARRTTAGERRIGWKVALTSKPTQEQFNFHEPAFGHVLEQFSSGHRLPADMIRPGCEPEICVRLARPIAAGADADTVRAAIEVCYPALEIVELRCDLRRDMALSLADNVAQKAIVLGVPVRMADLPDLGRIETRVRINGVELAVGLGEAVLGHPLNAIIWLAGKLPEHGQALTAGDLIMTGSFTRMLPLAAGDQVQATFTGLGEVETSVSG
jgi:2-keto-4-pentenoate hydratase